jgi:hypothetical protein
VEDSKLFATLSFKGDRFNGEFIPVEVLPIIAAYQETLIELAKSIWRDENPDKSKLPKNFSKCFDLGLDSIGQGSKVARLPRRQISASIYLKAVISIQITCLLSLKNYYQES